MTPRVVGRSIAIAASGLGHVARGNEAWAEDLGRALADRGESVILCKGGGRAEASYERVIPCWRREQARTAGLLKAIPRRLSWRIGLGSPYAVEQTTFALGLVGVLRRERVDILHVQDPIVARFIQIARKMGLTKARGHPRPWHRGATGIPPQGRLSATPRPLAPAPGPRRGDLEVDLDSNPQLR